MTMPTVAQLIVWIVVGLIGGYLFRWLDLLPGLDKVSVSLRDIVAAVAGSLLVLAAIWIYRRYAR